MTCPTPCEWSCDSECHELHFPSWNRDHKYEDCPGRWQANPGWDVPGLFTW